MSRLFFANVFLSTFIVAYVYANHCPTKCGENETCNSCGSQCELKCSNPNLKICSLICSPPACACNEDFARDETTNNCVLKDSCPP